MKQFLINQSINQSINILDLYGGEGRIWNEIRKRTKWNINTLRMDVKPDRKGIYLKGDNIKFIKNMNLEFYDVVDCDAYGIPYLQLKELFSKNYRGIIFITYIQSIFGKLPVKLLGELGYSETMVKKIPTLFNNNGIEKFKSWLSLYGITTIKRVSFNRKHYLSINMRQQ